jgi:hypothetical protein
LGAFAGAIVMDIPVAVLGPSVGVVVGWTLAVITRHFEEVWFGARLKVDCQGEPGNKAETDNDVWIKFRVQNTKKRKVAKNCRAYLVALHRISNNKVVSGNLISDSFQLPWSGYDFTPRDIPAEVSQYVDLVRFSKHDVGWIFSTKPNFYESLSPLKKQGGTYRFTVIVPAIKQSQSKGNST